MSTLLADTIRKTGGTAGVDIRIKNTSVYESDGGTSVTQNLVQGLIKCWLSCDGTPASRDSYNVSSLTDVATGQFQTNITSAFSNVNHCTSTGLEIADGGNANYMYQMLMVDRAGETTSRVEINTGYRAHTDASFADNFDYWHQTSGDLA
jgi:hypothetical protein